MFRVKGIQNMLYYGFVRYCVENADLIQVAASRTGDLLTDIGNQENQRRRT